MTMTDSTSANILTETNRTKKLFHLQLITQFFKDQQKAFVLQIDYLPSL